MTPLWSLITPSLEYNRVQPNSTNSEQQWNTAKVFIVWNARGKINFFTWEIIGFKQFQNWFKLSWERLIWTKNEKPQMLKLTNQNQVKSNSRWQREPKSSFWQAFRLSMLSSTLNLNIDIFAPCWKDRPILRWLDGWDWLIMVS